MVPYWVVVLLALHVYLASLLNIVLTYQKIKMGYFQTWIDPKQFFFSPDHPSRVRQRFYLHAYIVHVCSLLFLTEIYVLKTCINIILLDQWSLAVIWYVLFQIVRNVRLTDKCFIYGKLYELGNFGFEVLCVKQWNNRSFGMKHHLYNRRMCLRTWISLHNLK